MTEKVAGGKAKTGRPQRRQPVRTCVACRQSGNKRELVRVVRTPEGRVEIDPTGKKAGRGAYLCRTADCWSVGLKKHALERALKVSIGADDLHSLEEFAAALSSSG